MQAGRCFIAALCAWCLAAQSQERTQLAARELVDLSLEELANVELRQRSLDPHRILGRCGLALQVIEPALLERRRARNIEACK